MLRFAIQNLSDATILHCTGRLTSAHAEALRTAVPPRPCGGTLVLDLAGVTAVDAAGLGALLSVRIRCKEAGTALKLMNVRPMLLKLFELTRLNSAFEICSGR